VNTLPDGRGARPGVAGRQDADTPPDRLRALALELRFPLGAYLVARIVCMAIAGLDLPLQHWPLHRELANWDGHWYLALAQRGYPSHVVAGYSTLGFLPLFPLGIWLLAQLLSSGYLVAGMLLSGLTGAAATVLVGRLAADWWGERVSRRAVVLFCAFPGSAVFSMVYTEGLLLTLVAGCLLALARRRWLLAGVLAGASTAVAPVALAIVPACALAAAAELHRAGWRDRGARRSLIAPLLSPLGLVAFGAYLWLHTGTPLASYDAQHHAWKETASPLALPHLAIKLVRQLLAFHTLHHPGVNLNIAAGVLGAVFLLIALRALWLERARVPPAALAWTAGVSLLTLTSYRAPPNPRMLLCAFPAVIVFARRLRRRGYTALAWGSGAVLVAMTFFSYVGYGLRP
jgi:MFS family permease